MIKSGNREFGISHFTNGEVMSWYGFARRIITENKLQNKVKILNAIYQHSKVRRPKNSILISPTAKNRS
jgi:dTDP-4-dehydrorhamnose reductase